MPKKFGQSFRNNIDDMSQAEPCITRNRFLIREHEDIKKTYHLEIIIF